MLSKITIVLVCICHFKYIIMLNIVMYRPCYTAITRGFLIFIESTENKEEAESFVTSSSLSNTGLYKILS